MIYIKVASSYSSDRVIAVSQSLSYYNNYYITVTGITVSFLKIISVAADISASIIQTGDLQIVLESILNSGRICRMFVEEIGERINTPIGETSVTIANPQVHN